jgi:hypothetical protein
MSQRLPPSNPRRSALSLLISDARNRDLLKLPGPGNLQAFRSGYKTIDSLTCAVGPTASVPIADCLNRGVHPKAVCQQCAEFSANVPMTGTQLLAANLRR